MRLFLNNYFPNLYAFLSHIKRRLKIINIFFLKRKRIVKKRHILEKMYFKKIGHKLNWNNLTTYTEKMQWEKFYNVNTIKTQLSDKYLVRDWIKNKIGSEYLIPLLGVWEKFDDIDFNKLPDKFVLKTNHGSGTIVVVKDKKALNYRQLKRLFEDWLDTDYAYCTGFEMHYSKIKPLIIAEKYIESFNGQLEDYKFICFNGDVHYCWVDIDRFSNHCRNVYDLKWNLQEWNQGGYRNSEIKLTKPKNFKKMVEIAHCLCKSFSHVRVDLYNVNGKIYFGEMTFTNGSGFDKIIPEKYDLILGKMWDLDK